MEVPETEVAVQKYNPSLYFLWHMSLDPTVLWIYPHL